MRYIFNFPDIGEGLDEGSILEWYVVKGQVINSGDPLVKMETDKVVTDIPSPRSGTIAALYGKVGETIHVGDPLVEIEMEGVEGEAAVEELKKEVFAGSEEEGVGVVGTMEVAGNSAYLPAGNEGMEIKEKQEKILLRKALATPVARALAKELGIDINLVEGTGPGGRVMIEDVRKYSDSSKRAEDQAMKVPVLFADRITYEPLSQLRKTIARNMQNSKHSAAHMSIYDEADMAELIRVREKYKPLLAEKGVKLSYLPFILKATAQALKKHRQLNSQLDMENNRMLYKNYYNIGIAVDTVDGLVVPVIHDVDILSIAEIAIRINDFSVRARERKLTLDDMKDGTFTVTNYGSIGGMFGTPIINYPQAGILGTGRILEKPVFRGDKVEKGTFLPLSLSVDHRIVDGGEVTRFLNTLIEYLSDPVSMMID